MTLYVANLHFFLLMLIWLAILPSSSDVDSSLLSSAIIFLPDMTQEETIQILNPLDFTISAEASRLIVTANNVMAPIEEFEQVLQSTVYSTTRQM